MCLELPHALGAQSQRLVLGSTLEGIGLQLAAWVCMRMVLPVWLCTLSTTTISHHPKFATRTADKNQGQNLHRSS